MIGPPTSTDWESASIFVKFLSTFYDVTLKFTGTLHVTSNNFYHEICEIHSQLTELADANDPLLSLMAFSMKEKYDKYCGTVEKINPLLFLAVVLDPRYKMKYLKYCFESVYDSETVARIIVLVESVLKKLYNCYNVGPDSADNKDAGGESRPKSSTMEETRRRRLLENYLQENYLQQQQMQTPENKNDVDKYLAEEPLNTMTSSFDILFWWKENSSRYKIISLIAKDVLVIPVSTVASEAAFSTSGRILDPFRSSLSPKMLEVLVCTKSWLKEGCGGMKSKEYLDEIQSYQFLEEGDMDKDKGAWNDKLKTKIVDVIDN